MRRGKTVDLSESPKEYTITIRMTWYEIFILIRYKVIILIAIVLVVRLVDHVYRLCNFNYLQMPDRILS